MLSAALPSGGGFDMMGSAMVAMAMTDSSAEEVRSLVTARPFFQLLAAPVPFPGRHHDTNRNQGGPKVKK